jgi:cell division protein FtsW
VTTAGRPIERSAARPAPAPDAALVAAVMLLAGLGLVMIHSATAPFTGEAGLFAPHFERHVAAVLVGAAFAVGVARLPLAFWRRAALPFWALGVALLLTTLLFGVQVNGARRWLLVPGLGMRFQPAELAKLATVIAVAALLARPDEKPPTTPARIVGPALLALIPAALLVAQPDLGNAVLLVALVGGLLFVAGSPLPLFAWAGLLGTAFVSVYAWLNPYAWARLTGFLDPWGRSDAEGFQLVQSFVGFARGGVFGMGLGDGRQKLYYLPEAHTDFILAVIAEELGLAGVLFVLGLFAALAVAGIQIARRARDRFALLLAFGATALLALPAVLNTAVVTGAIPTKGLPLPFLSYGRTSLLAAFAAVGLLVAVAHQRPGAPRRWRS